MPTTVGISFFKSSPEEGLSYKVKKASRVISESLEFTRYLHNQQVITR